MSLIVSVAGACKDFNLGVKTALKASIEGNPGKPPPS